MALSGAIVAIVALMISLIYLLQAVFGTTEVVGWTSLILSIWFLGGANVLAAGMLGIYLGRALREAKGRPSFVISRTVNLSDRDAND